MEQAKLYDLADDLAEYILGYAKRNGVEVTIGPRCCGTLELRYLTESGGYISADVDVEPITGDVE